MYLLISWRLINRSNSWQLENLVFLRVDRKNVDWYTVSTGRNDNVHDIGQLKRLRIQAARSRLDDLMYKVHYKRIVLEIVETDKKKYKKKYKSKFN